MQWKRRLRLIDAQPGAKGMKVAFATQDLKRVDAHFGWAKNLAIYEISQEGHRFLEAIQFDGDLQEDGNEDKLTPKLNAIHDCAILYVAAIGGSAAARVVAKNIHPVKVGQPEDIADILAAIAGGARGHTTPVATKSAAQGPGARTGFRRRGGRSWLRRRPTNRCRATAIAARAGGIARRSGQSAGLAVRSRTYQAMARTGYAWRLGRKKRPAVARSVHPR